MIKGYKCSITATFNVSTNCKRYGISCSKELSSQRLGSKKLHVSLHQQDLDTKMFKIRISHEGIIKVADFGLSKSLYENVYVKDLDEGVKLPIKWMAIESIQDCKFSEKTDVVCNMYRLLYNYI